MTEELRRAFDHLVVGEPALRITANDTVAKGVPAPRRQRWPSL